MPLFGTKQSDSSRNATAYERHKERAGARQKEMSISGREIGDLPEVVNPKRKKRAERDFKYFCEQYFLQTFSLKWSPDHLRVIAKIEQAVLVGGLFAMAMPRGNGKTCLCEEACIWALNYGHRGFVALIGADEGAATDMLDSIKIDYETNDVLMEDFPEICFPIRCLEGIHQRAKGQLYHGRPTRIGWTAEEIILPTIAESKASGGIIRVRGITGRIRGMKHKKADGTPVRPSLVVIDDPQTDESARSPSQCATRERILSGAILGLAGPGMKIAGLLPVTVIRPDDMADRILNHKLHPQWQGERTKMVIEWPTNETLWEQYAKLRQESQESGASPEVVDKSCNKFYRAHRKAMDAGGEVAWPERREPGELSGLQSAWNIRIDRGEAAFFAEYQNEPLPEVAEDKELLTADQIAAKTNGHHRGEIPIGCTKLTMFIDIHGAALYWIAVAWEDEFTGYIVDYGTEPDQKTAYFTLTEIKRTLQRAMPKAGLEAAIYAGLERLAERTIGDEWRRDGGSVMRVDRCLIDANWGRSTDIVYQFCRQSKYAGVVMPSHGKGIGAANKPLNEYQQKHGDRVGLNWRSPVPVRRAVRHIIFDTNFWKSFTQERLAVSMGDPGCLSLFGRRADQHRLLADHLTAEYRVPTEGRGRKVDEWRPRTEGRDNHWLDGLVGCAVAASIEGIDVFREREKPIRRKRISLREWAAQSRGRVS